MLRVEERDRKNGSTLYAGWKTEREKKCGNRVRETILYVNNKNRLLTPHTCTYKHINTHTGCLQYEQSNSSVKKNQTYNNKIT